MKSEREEAELGMWAEIKRAAEDVRWAARAVTAHFERLEKRVSRLPAWMVPEARFVCGERAGTILATDTERGVVLARFDPWSCGDKMVPERIATTGIDNFPAMPEPAKEGA